jgi:predicted RNA binding protein YcfA (HicA-like mRNA interferase family)
MWIFVFLLQVLKRGSNIVTKIADMQVIVRQRGSHIRMKKVTPEFTIKLTIPLHGTLDRGTLKSIIKSSGLTTEEFVELL